MKKLFKNVIKAGMTMFLIGVLLGVVVPEVATLLGPDLLGKEAFAEMLHTHTLKTGVFFGLFGAASAVLTPAVNYVFGDRPEKTVTAKTLGVRSKTLGYEQGIDPSVGHGVAHDPSVAASMASSATHFQDMIASRAASGVKPPSIG